MAKSGKGKKSKGKGQPMTAVPKKYLDALEDVYRRAGQLLYGDGKMSKNTLKLEKSLKECDKRHNQLQQYQAATEANKPLSDEQRHARDFVGEPPLTH